MTIGIKAISSYIPTDFVDNIALAAKFGETEDFVTDKLGAVKLPRKSASEETSDLCVMAVNTLLQRHPQLSSAEVDAIIVVTQNGDAEGLPHTASIVQHKLGLPKNIAAFDISLGCSGYVYGLYALKGFLESSGLKNGILITADPYSKVIDPDDRVTSMLFGDAATATWLGNDAIYSLGKVAYGTDGSGAEHLKVTDGRLSMNGRQVFNFASMNVPPHIKNLLQSANINEDDIDAFLLHQGSAAIVDAIARRFSHPQRFIKDIVETGNTVSSSIPLLLEKYAASNNWNNIVISGFGVGLSWASAILHKN